MQLHGSAGVGVRGNGDVDDRGGGRGEWGVGDWGHRSMGRMVGLDVLGGEGGRRI